MHVFILSVLAAGLKLRSARLFEPLKWYSSIKSTGQVKYCWETLKGQSHEIKVWFFLASMDRKNPFNIFAEGFQLILSPLKYLTLDMNSTSGTSFGLYLQMRSTVPMTKQSRNGISHLWQVLIK